MDVAEPVALTEFLRRSSERGGVVADQRGMPLAGLPESAGELLLVGPEGGFDSDEEQRLERLGWPRLRLGAHTLRAGTAAVVGAAFLLMRAESR